MKLVKSNRGAGLIDVMLTLFLLGMAGMIFAAVFPTSIKATRQAQEYKVATSIAQRKMEQLRAMNYESLTSTLLRSAGVVDSESESSPYQFSSVDNVADQLPLGEGELTVETESSDTKRVIIDISWRGVGGSTRGIQLTTLFTDRRTRKMD